jgi:hypothetical protein
MTGLGCDVVEFEGHVLSIVQGPRDDSHPPEEDGENRRFNRSAAFHFVIASVRGTFSGVKEEDVEAFDTPPGLKPHGFFRLRSAHRPTLTPEGPARPHFAAYRAAGC